LIAHGYLGGDARVKSIEKKKKKRLGKKKMRKKNCTKSIADPGDSQSPSTPGGVTSIRGVKGRSSWRKRKEGEICFLTRQLRGETLKNRGKAVHRGRE